MHIPVRLKKKKRITWEACCSDVRASVLVVCKNWYRAVCWHV